MLDRQKRVGATLKNGLWCDTVAFSGPACGANNDRYSSAGTGMGLVSEAVAVEVGSADPAVARKRVVETLTSVLAQWPAEPHTGFRVRDVTRRRDP